MHIPGGVKGGRSSQGWLHTSTPALANPGLARAEEGHFSRFFKWRTGYRKLKSFEFLKYKSWIVKKCFECKNIALNR